MSYNPARMGTLATIEELRSYVELELERISKEFNETIALDLRAVHQEPKRPREGMIVSADGSNWNPGSGAGAYEFVGGVWRRVSGLVAGDYGDVVVDGSGNIAIDNNSVTLAKMADMATARILGRITAGSGDPEALTGTQVTTMLDVFTSGLKGLVPASGGSATQFLSADGTFKAVPTSSSTNKQSITLSGTNTAFTSVPAHDIAFISVGGASHNSGSNQALQLELSNNNGSSYDSVITLSGVANAATAFFQGITITQSADLSTQYVTVGGTNFGAARAYAGPITAYRLSFSGGSFDAGSALLTTIKI